MRRRLRARHGFQVCALLQSIVSLRKSAPTLFGPVSSFRISGGTGNRVEHPSISEHLRRADVCAGGEQRQHAEFGEDRFPAAAEAEIGRHTSELQSLAYLV